MKEMMKIAQILLVVTIFATFAGAEGGEPRHRRLSAVPFTEVNIQGGFWAPVIRTNREKTLPHNLKWCEQTGRISNFSKARVLLRHSCDRAAIVSQGARQRQYVWL